MRFERLLEDERLCWRLAAWLSVGLHLVALAAYGLTSWLSMAPADPWATQEAIEVEVVALTGEELERLMTRANTPSGSSFTRPDSLRAASRRRGQRRVDLESIRPNAALRPDVPEASLPPGALRLMEEGEELGRERNLFRSRARGRVDVDTDLLAQVVGSDQALEAQPDSGTGELLEAPVLSEALARSIVLYREAPRYEERWKQLGMAGVGVFEFRVDREGVVSSVDVVQSTGYIQLDQAGIEALRRWSFNAPEMEKQRTPYRFRQRFTW